ncbi:MAG: D-Ala-D-Ala carboxypeptidase family metallohydrolase [Luteolibacter sp.]
MNFSDDLTHTPKDNEEEFISLDSMATRRSVIGTLGLATTALCASSIPANAWWFGNKEELPVVKVKSESGKYVDTVGGLPQEWVKRQGGNLQSYAKYINSLKLKNITAQQVISAHAKKRGNTWNCLPPKQWWTRMGYTLRVVDAVSTSMKVGVKEVVSAYRCPEYNARCGGAKARSWHQANVAVDVQFHTSARNVTAAARNLRDRGLFKGGVGSYSSFTHIDTRGSNVNW